MKAADEDRLPDSVLLAMLRFVPPTPPPGPSCSVKCQFGAKMTDGLALIALECSTFMFAGADTTSNGLSRILHLLCEHPDVQDKLRAEIRAAIEQYSEEVPYDELCALPYLDAVCRETLRL